MITFSAPLFHSNHDVLNCAFRIAVGDLFSNIIPYRSGVLGSPQPTLMAGLDYESPWTRDAAINCWNGGSLLVPEAARNTLLGVLEQDGDGCVRVGGQYWDRVIWISGAWHHYLVTGDQAFLEIAASAARATLVQHEIEEFDPTVGLFRGAACFQDGVSGYPDRYARANGSSDIRDWVLANPDRRSPKGFGLPMMVCSTNCLYFAAYRDAARIVEALGQPGAEDYRMKAGALRESIFAHFWDETAGMMNYLFDDEGMCCHQEGLGSAFSLLFEIAGNEKARRILENQHITAHGIPCVWPTFDRYRTADGMGFGRHSGTVWPHVQGFWAEAAARHGRTDLLYLELMSLAGKAVRDAQFTEIYHPLTGEIYGGRQERLSRGSIEEWPSCRRQTWSATALFRMVLHGVIGMRFDEDVIRFEPQLAFPVSELTLNELNYRNALLSLSLTGTGAKIRRFEVNGQSRQDAAISANESGKLDIRIELAE